MFLFVCDESDYLLNETRWAITSLARHEPAHRVRLVLFDSTGRHDAQLRRWHPRLEITHFVPDMPVDRSKPGYFFSYKALIFEAALQATDEDMIFLDGDIIVRGPLSPIFETMGRADMAIRYRPSLDLEGPMGSSGAARFNAGVIALRNSERTRALMGEVRRLIVSHLEQDGDTQSDGPAITGIDQEALWIAYEHDRDRIALHPLDDSYNDSYFWPDSVIWHAKGKARRHHMYRAAVIALKFGLPGRMLLKWHLTRRRRWARRTIAARIRARDRVLGLSEKDLAAAIARVRGGVLISFSSDFLLANPDLMEAARQVTCHDWDPAAFHANRAAMDAAAVSHAFCHDPGSVDISHAALVLGDTDRIAPGDAVILRHLPIGERFQDTSTLLRLIRSKQI